HSSRGSVVIMCSVIEDLPSVDDSREERRRAYERPGKPLHPRLRILPRFKPHQDRVVRLVANKPRLPRRTGGLGRSIPCLALVAPIVLDEPTQLPLVLLIISVYAVDPLGRLVEYRLEAATLQ